MTQDVRNADRIKRRGAAVVWRFACQFEENLRQQKIPFDQFEDLRSLLGQAGREGSRMDLRRVVFGLPNAASDAAISRSIQRRTSGGADLTCSTEKVKLVIWDTLVL